MGQGIPVLELPFIIERMGDLLVARDLSGFNAYMFELGLRALDPSAIEELAREVLEVMPHDVRVWWGEPCDCARCN